MSASPPVAEAVASRLSRLLRHAGLQQRVLARPFPGLAHAGLLLGLAVLAAGSGVVQLDALVLAPSGLGLGKGAAFHGLQVALDVAGLAVLVAALALVARNLTRARRALPRAWQRHAILGGLCALCLTGFLLQGLRVSLDPTATASSTAIAELFAGALRAGLVAEPERLALYRGLLWAHLGLVGALFAAAPLSPLLHALLLPVQLVVGKERLDGAPPQPFDLRELIAAGRFDVRVGLRTADDLDAGARLGLLSCTQCQRCDEVCPALAAGTALSPSALVRKLRSEAERRPGSAGPAPLVPGTVSADELWSCLLCGACTGVCPALLDPPALSLELRRELASTGKLDGRRAEALANLARTGNPYGLPRATRALVPAELAAAPAATSPGCATVYWLGCAATYDGRLRRVAEATMGLLRRAGVEFVVLGGEEACCGDPARRLGEEGRFQELALGNIATLERRGVRRIVTHCAHCFTSLSGQYPALGASFEVVHHATLLRDLLAGKALVPASQPSQPSQPSPAVTFHDACSVGRYCGEFEAPRACVRAVPGTELVELPRRRESSACCGGGGGGYWFDVPRTERPGGARLREARDAGVRRVVVECPFCLRMLEDAATGLAPEEAMVVLDLSEHLAAALGPATTPDEPVAG